jgi:hypothetical protein
MSDPREKMTIRWAGSLLILAAIGSAARADQVWIEPQRPTSTQSDWYPRAIETRSGTVVQFDSEQLRLQPTDDADQIVIAAARVLWIEPGQVSELEAEAMDLFARGENSSSLRKLPEILAAKPPVWRQQWMTMNAAVAAWKSGRADISLELVSQLDRRPLPPVAIAWLPIAWTNRPLPANGRLADPSPVVQLVAASWLLSSPQRNQGLAVLKQLETQDRKEIAKFARILSWRAASPPEVIESCRGWEAAIDSLPMVWQTGPLTLLIDKLRAANQLESANRLRWSLELTPIHPHFDWMQESRSSSR